MPEVSLQGKNIVVTGASRGIGLATALELVNAGANVWGTSRTPWAYPPKLLPNPLLEFHFDDPASIAAFVRAIDAATNRRVDVLINNAGQFVFGGTVPPISSDPDVFRLWAQKSALALQVIYLGHRMLTSAMWPHATSWLPAHASYSAYGSGAGIVSEFYQPYTSGKQAIADFANSLRDWFSLIGLDIGVATVNPVATHTDGPFGLRPIFLEPVDSNGNPDKASPLAVVLPLFRATVLKAQPPAKEALAYRQLLELNTPHPNVLAGVPTGPLAAAGQLPLILAARQMEMEQSAMPWKCGDA